MYLHDTNEAQIFYYVGSTHWRAPCSSNDILYRIETISLRIYENRFIVEGHTTFLVHFTMLWPYYQVVAKLFETLYM